MLGYGPTKVRMMCITGDLRSLKDGGSRRILPAWVDEYVAMRAAEAEAGGAARAAPTGRRRSRCFRPREAAARHAHRLLRAGSQQSADIRL